jgi:hypothetical protein
MLVLFPMEIIVMKAFLMERIKLNEKFLIEITAKHVDNTEILG